MPRSATMFTYINEISPDSYHEIMTLAVYLGDGITFVISGIFVKYTRDVYLFLILLGIMTIICVIILTIYLPESPRFLYSKKRFPELIANLRQVARLNGVADPDGKIVDEMVETLI